MKAAGEYGGYSYVYEKVIAKNGNITFKINDRYIHSPYTPEREEKKEYPRNSLLMIFGYGAGYHIHALKNANPHAKILVFEPFIPVDQEAISFCKENEIIFLNDLEISTIINEITDCLGYGFARLQFHSLQAYQGLFPKVYDNFTNQVTSAYKIFIQNLLTQANFIPLWYKNTLKTLLENHPFLSFEKQALHKEYTILCGAGPSLTDMIPNLIKYRKKLFICATDTALIPLVAAGLIPDMVVTLDSQHYSIYDFIIEKSFNTTFVRDIQAFDCTKHLAWQSFITSHSYNEDSLIAFFMKKLQINIVKIYTGGTVSDYALDILIKLGFKNIILTGYDLSFPKIQTHARNAPSHIGQIINSNYFQSIEQLMCESIMKRKPHLVPTKKGGEVLSDFVLQNYQNYLEQYVELHPKINFFSTAQQSSLIKHITYLSQNELIKLLKNAPESSFRIENMNAEKNSTYASEINIQNRKKNERIETLKTLLDQCYNYSQALALLMPEVETKIEITQQVDNLIIKIIEELPFMRSFLIMTEIILYQKGVDAHSALGLRHRGFRLLQSLYYMVRSLQKVLHEK